MQKLMVFPIFTVAFLAGADISPTHGQQQEKSTVQMQRQEDFYGSQLMTPQEREEFQTRMRSATTLEEREKIRREHHEKMQERAREMGVPFPEEPPERGMGGGMGPGGMGPGRGMGGGRR